MEGRSWGRAGLGAGDTPLLRGRMRRGSGSRRGTGPALGGAPSWAVCCPKPSSCPIAQAGGTYLTGQRGDLPAPPVLGSCQLPAIPQGLIGIQSPLSPESPWGRARSWLCPLHEPQDLDPRRGPWAGQLTARQGWREPTPPLLLLRKGPGDCKAVGGALVGVGQARCAPPQWDPAQADPEGVFL